MVIVIIIIISIQRTQTRDFQILGVSFLVFCTPSRQDQGQGQEEGLRRGAASRGS